jgi:hypothetical protein
LISFTHPGLRAFVEQMCEFTPIHRNVQQFYESSDFHATEFVTEIEETLREQHTQLYTHLDNELKQAFVSKILKDDDIPDDKTLFSCTYLPSQVSESSVVDEKQKFFEDDNEMEENVFITDEIEDW